MTGLLVKRLRLVFLLLIFISILNVNESFVPSDVLKRFEYKLSFKGPHLVFKDGTIPFWEHGGSAIASNDQIRLTPSIRSQKGRIWSKNTIQTPDWEIEAVLRVNGRGRVGADGMAIWYTDKIGTDGPVFGSNDNWNGLGIFLDSFDNDNQQNNPYIMMMTNDGSKVYDHQRDGITQQLGGCLRDFRNKPFPIRIKVEYYKRAITVSYHAGLTNDLSTYEICTRVENIDLPKNGHFGVSAATGGLADDQDVLAFITHSLIDRTMPETVTPSTEEQAKLEREYQEFLKQLESEKEKYAKEHPEKQAEIDEKRFEGEYDRQFNMILEVQNSIHQSMRLLDSKLAEILGRQERIVSMLSSGNNNNMPPPGVTAQYNSGSGSGSLPVDTIRRDEVNHLMTIQNDLVKNIRDISANIADVQRKANFLSDNARNQPNQINSQQVGSNYQDQSMLQQISDGIKNFKSEMSLLITRNQPRCPELPSCVSGTFLIIIILAQTILLIGFYVVKNKSDNQKKFY